MKPLRNPRTQVTIGQGMVAIVLLAALLALPHLQTDIERWLAVGAFAMIPMIVFVKTLLEMLCGIPCPGCARWTLRRLARARFYYRCAECGARFKRFGLGPWHDASGPDFDAIYRGKSGARPWLGFVIPEHPGDTTTGSLLRDQRQRRQEAPLPNTPGTTFLHWKSRATSWLSFAIPTSRGDTTTGTLLQNQRRRRGGPAPKAIEKPLPLEDADATG